MKNRLLVAYYWWPWNNAGTFRWLNFLEYIKADVLTSEAPVESFPDYTIPADDCEQKVIYLGKKWKAKIWGLVAPLKILFMRKKYDTLIFTSSPETLIIWAYIFQLLGKRVLLDMRDSLDRERMSWKILKPIYKFCYKRIKHVIVAWKFIDSSKHTVYHGYEEIKGFSEFKGYFKPQSRMTYLEYHQKLKAGYAPDLSGKPKGDAASCIHTLKYLGFPINNPDLVPEIYYLAPSSWKESAGYLNNLLKHWDL